MNNKQAEINAIVQGLMALYSQTFNTHVFFQKSMAESYLIYVRNAESSTRKLIQSMALEYMEASIKELNVKNINEKERSFNVLISKKKMPYIDSHRIKGNIVVPGVTIVDLGLRAFMSYNPLYKVVRCNNSTIKKGIQLGDNETQLFIIKCIENGEFVDVSFLSQKGELHYTCKIYRNSFVNKPNIHIENFENRKMSKWPYDVNEAYNKYLFHGKYFRSIKELKGVSEDGASAVLFGSIDLEWPDGNYAIDQAVIDGGGQLQILWGQFLDGRLSLPVYIESVIVYNFGLLKGPIYVELEKVSANELKKVANIYYFDTNGDLICELRGLTLYTISNIT